MASASVYSGSKSGIGGTAAQLTTTSIKLYNGLTVFASGSNGGVVAVAANSGITYNTDPANDGFPLVAGASIFLPINDPSKVYVVASTNGNVVYWVGG